jgi:hypothetical protein
MQYDASQAIYQYLLKILSPKTQSQARHSNRFRYPAGKAKTQKNLLQFKRKQYLTKLKKVLGKAPPIT